MTKLTTDNIAMVAILALDVRPSSICVSRASSTNYELQVLRHETIGRPFDFYVQRFAGVLKNSFRGTALAGIVFKVKIVDSLYYKFEEQRAWRLATTPIKVGN